MDEEIVRPGRNTCILLRSKRAYGYDHCNYMMKKNTDYVSEIENAIRIAFNNLNRISRAGKIITRTMEDKTMKYAGMPAGMWLLFSGSFRKRLSSVLKYDARTAGEITANAKKKYREIIASVPEFEKEDRFKMNLVNCAMLSAFLLNMPARPTLEQATDYYRESMMTGPMKRFCRMSGKRKFTESDIAGMKKAQALNPAERNPYSWNMEYLPYEDGSGYEARFTTCGICVLMKELGLSDLVPAMCRLDYTMSEAGGASEFIRRYTLASGGPYCDCGYKKKVKAVSQ